MEHAPEAAHAQSAANAEIPDHRLRHQRDIPSDYSPVIFFGTTNLAGAGIVAAAAWQLEAVAPLEWLIVPAAFLFSNAVEYFIHRGPLHHKQEPLEIMFKRHTLLHHDYFRHDDMAIARRQEVVAVVFPYWAIGFVLAGALVPYALLLMVATPNAAHLFVVTAIAYYLLYEWLHLVYHLPDTVWIGRFGLVRRLRQHHRIHHHTRLMQRFNFNITFPIFDALLRTTYAGQDVEAEARPVRKHHRRRHKSHREPAQTRR